MTASVTQDLVVRITPVNNPHRSQDGFYRAYVVGGRPDYGFILADAEREVARGIIPASVGYGSAVVPETAVEVAVKDYVSKHSPLCIANGGN